LGKGWWLGRIESGRIGAWAIHILQVTLGQVHLQDREGKESDLERLDDSVKGGNPTAG
jgi:hypothetical protein